MNHFASSAIALSMALAGQVAQADPFQLIQDDVGNDQVRISLAVGALDDLAAWADAKAGFSADGLSTLVEGIGFSVAFGGGYAASGLVDGSFASTHGIVALDVPPTPDGFGAGFSYGTAAPLESGRMLVSFLVDRPISSAGTVSLGSISIFPLFIAQVMDGESKAPAWSETSVAAVVPEPASYALMALGVAGLLARRRFQA